MRLSMLSLVVLSGLACSSARRATVDGGSIDDGPTTDAAMDAPAPDDAATTRCVVAAKLGSCCMTFVAVSEAEVAADHCLVPSAARGENPPQCPPPDPGECAAVRCAKPEAQSRIAKLGADGTCTFANECASVADCALAANIRGCCACAAPYPATLVEQDDCLFQRDDDPASCEQRCDAADAGIACEQCMPPPSMTCAASNKEARIKLCQVDASGCTCGGGCDEGQQCLQNQGGGLGPEGPVCGDVVGLAECRQLCDPEPCPPSRPNCTRIEFVVGCCSDALTSHKVCCANEDATDVTDCR